MTKTGNKIIELNNVSFAYDRGSKVLENITLSINTGERVGIIGANGTGKSTLFKLLTGLLYADGDIKVGGLEVNKKNLEAIRKRVGFALQDSDNQLFMPTLYDDLVFGPRNYGLSATDAEKAADAALSKMGIMELKNRSNMRMSGGEKRMAAIATILAMNPDIILMDEPSITLDPYNRRKLINNLNTMDQTLLVASHDLDMIYETCERVILIDEHRIKADGPAKEILTDRTLLEGSHLELPLCFQSSIPYNRESN